MNDNSYKPAFPRPGYEHSNLADHARYYHEDGLTKRELFAKDAPEVPPSWFRTLYGQSHENTIWDDEQLFFAWRLYFADELLKQLGEPNGNPPHNDLH